jgi:hypothetical protein
MRGRTEAYLKSGSRRMFFYEHGLPIRGRFLVRTLSWNVGASTLLVVYLRL